MIEIVNSFIALLTVGLGAFGLISPRFTAHALDLAPTESTMGFSELRASAGGLFVAMGLVCLITGAGFAYAMLGVAYAGAAVGRATAMALDNPPQPKTTVWFLFEVVPAAWLLWFNWPAL